MDGIAKGGESIAYGYDGTLVTSETRSGTLSQNLAYVYNNDFNLQSFTYAGQTETYAYDNDGLLIQAGQFAITRNAQTGLPEQVSGGALSQERSFNGYGELAAEETAIGSTSNSFTLTRDDTGRITDKTETVNGATSQYHYTYDPLGRLLTVTKDGTLVEEYRYDPQGTRNYEMNSLRTIMARDFTYSDEDHLLTAGAASYQYDVDGFLTDKTEGTEVTHYTYSSRGELLSVTFPNGALVEYLHDPMGRRIAKKVNGAITEKYLWQGLTRLLAVYDGADNLIMRFQYADDRMPVAMQAGGSIHYLAYDQVGSLRLVTDSSGNPEKQIDYDSFGNIINDTNTLFEIPFGFAGGLHDRDTGLVRFGYRDYDPDTGRWTAKDPIRFAGGDTDLYGYCLSDPVTLVDADGLLFGFDAGESSGESAALSWAEMSIDPSNSIAEDVLYTGMGMLASLWTPCTSDNTFWTLLPAGAIGKWLGRPFWRYVGPHSSRAITWLTRGWGWKAPFGRDFLKAAKKLHLGEYGGIPTDVIRVPYKMLKPIAGPKLVEAYGKFTGAVEYYWGKLLFPK